MLVGPGPDHRLRVPMQRRQPDEAEDGGGDGTGQHHGQHASARVGDDSHQQRQQRYRIADVDERNRERRRRQEGGQPAVAGRAQQLGDRQHADRHQHQERERPRPAGHAQVRVGADHPRPQHQRQRGGANGGAADGAAGRERGEHHQDHGRRNQVGVAGRGIDAGDPQRGCLHGVQEREHVPGVGLAVGQLADGVQRQVRHGQDLADTRQVEHGISGQRLLPLHRDQGGDGRGDHEHQPVWTRGCPAAAGRSPPAARSSAGPRSPAPCRRSARPRSRAPARASRPPCRPRARRPACRPCPAAWTGPQRMPAPSPAAPASSPRPAPAPAARGARHLPLA